eukprot:SAG31_NODE_6482_length_2001_cov_42.976190_1_plen_336_part_00
MYREQRFFEQVTRPALTTSLGFGSSAATARARHPSEEWRHRSGATRSQPSNRALDSLTKNTVSSAGKYSPQGRSTRLRSPAFERARRSYSVGSETGLQHTSAARFEHQFRHGATESSWRDSYGGARSEGQSWTDRRTIRRLSEGSSASAAASAASDMLLEEVDARLSRLERDVIGQSVSQSKYSSSQSRRQYSAPHELAGSYHESHGYELGRDGSTQELPLSCMQLGASRIELRGWTHDIDGRLAPDTAIGCTTSLEEGQQPPVRYLHDHVANVASSTIVTLAATAVNNVSDTKAEDEVELPSLLWVESIISWIEQCKSEARCAGDMNDGERFYS